MSRGYCDYDLGKDKGDHDIWIIALFLIGIGFLIGYLF